MSATTAQASQADDSGQSQAGTPTETPQAGTEETLTPAELRAALSAANKEAAATRTKLRAFEREAETKRQAELSEVEQRDARIRALEESLSTHQQKARDYALRDALTATFTADDFPVTPLVGAAQLLKLIDADRLEWTEQGEPTNAGKVLGELVKAAPALFQAKARRPGPGDMGSGNRTPTNADMNAMIRGNRG